MGETPVTTQPGDGTAAGNAGRCHLRASHADREQVIGTLQAAFVAGMVTKDEFDARTGRALVARTYADLDVLTADIPSGLTGSRPLEPARESAKKKKKAVAALACATPATVGMLVAVPPMPDGSPFAVPVIVLMCLLFGAVATGWLLLLHAWIDERARRQSAQGLPPGAGGQASRRLPSAGTGGELPPPGHGHQHTAEAVPIRRPRPRFSRWPPVALPSAR
jgi:hypothetical protein